MKKILLIIFPLILLSCNKPKTAFICGDHKCINKAEAKQYFQDNLSIEVKILDNKNTKEFDLVELNLNDDSIKKKQINIIKKEKTTQEVKVLSKDQIKKIKYNLKKNNKDKKLAKKISNEDDKNKNKTKIKKKKNFKKKTQTKPIKNDNKNNKSIVDICTIIEKCSIEEISKYLLKEGKNKNFPDITIRQKKL